MITPPYKSFRCSIAGPTIAILAILFAQSAASEQLPNWDECIQRPKSFSQYIPRPICFPSSFKPTTELLGAENPYLFNVSKSSKNTAALQTHLTLVTQTLESSSTRSHDRAHFLLGLIHEKLGALQQAESSYRSSLLLRQNNPLLLFRLASVCYQQKNYAETVRTLKELHWRSRHLNSQVLLALGLTLTDAGQDLLALPYLRTASFSQNPASVDARRLLVKIQLRRISEQIDLAEQANLRATLLADLQGILALNPGDRDAAISLGRLLVEQSDPLLHAPLLTLAEQLTSQLSRDSQFTDTEAVRLLFDTLLKKRELDRAEEVLAKGLEISPKSASLLKAQKQLLLERKAEVVNVEKTEALDVIP